MMNWQHIYNNQYRLERYIQELLLKVDGFDSPTGYFSVEDWTKYTQYHYGKLAIKPTDSIFEVGCGAGAFLYPLFLQKHRVGGIDFANSLTSLANALMPNCNFQTAEAIELNAEQNHDVVLSHGVFLYFENLNYAREVIIKMIQKATSTIAILDINDADKEHEYHQLRMKTMTKEEYEKKYSGLSHHFYNKSFFEDIAKEYKLDIEVWDQTFKKYNNSQFRFNVIMKK
ncbi:class I SAM-dependent methyltransferase [Sulfurovum sp.]|uniref:class I SAM-dependent methyltransferase n=1 Tax=Sulfurovum sp. TaxID=1969726 RepID=UPI0025DA7FD3|nr:class I SAM-dependent methyltransferase [Sulfurovum sp.]